MDCLCPRHRQWLFDNPHMALQHWHMAMHMARGAVRSEHLPRAQQFYSNAFDIADLLLDANFDDDHTRCRFALSAVELAFSLRYSGQRTGWLADLVHSRLGAAGNSSLVDDLIASLQKLAQTDNPNDHHHTRPQADRVVFG